MSVTLTRIIPLAATALLLAAPSLAQRPLDRELVASGLGSPLYVVNAPEDRERLFVVDQNGNIYIVKNGVKLSTPFLNLTAQTNGGGERGLLGLAFHPDYQQNGWFFVNYTNNSGDTRVDRFTVSANPDIANAGSQVNIFSLAQPYSNHNGGCIQFGPDGYLYIATGDGGSAGDPGNRAQNRTNLHGKMLRLDVDNGLPYTIPPTNPFVSDPGTSDEIWALGLRNPWRFNFDPVTGDMYIADVGQNRNEYIHLEAGGSAGGLNYGWRIIEGNDCYNPSSGCNTAGLEFPIYEYGHSFFPVFRCSIIGSEVYRGRSLATMDGRYFFSDNCSRELWSFRYNPATGAAVQFTDHTAETGVQGTPKSLGRDLDGELYLCDGNSVYRIIPDGMRLQVPHLFTGTADTIVVREAQPGQPVYLAYSLVGLGSQPIPALGVDAEIASPALAGTSTANGAGTAAFPVVPPSVLFGRTVYLQALQNGRDSNVFREEVE